MAADLQSLPPADRLQRLKKIGVDRAQTDDLFVLCRMLYEPKHGYEFRGPLLGRPVFVGKQPSDAAEAAKRWPLEPITIRDDMPISIVRGYIVSGAPEKPLEYLEYCNRNCEWRLANFPNLTLPQRQNILKKCCESLDNLALEDKTYLFEQAED